MDLQLKGKTALITGAVDVDIIGFYRPGLWNISSIRIDGELQDGKGAYRTLVGDEDHPDRDTFAMIGSIVMIEYGEEIEKRLAARYGNASAYDTAREKREAA